MTQKIEEGIFFELVRALYNQHHGNLSQDLKEELLSAAKAIEDKGKLGPSCHEAQSFCHS